jgi:S-adenosylmethionine synthetase
MPEAPLPGANIDVGISALQGKVVMKWDHPTTLIVFDPQNASTIAEHLARAAFEAHTGRPPRDDISHLHAQVKNKVTEEMKKLLVRRISTMLNSTRHSPAWHNDRLALEIVDNVLTKVA